MLPSSKYRSSKIIDDSRNEKFSPILLGLFKKKVTLFSPADLVEEKLNVEKEDSVTAVTSDLSAKARASTKDAKSTSDKLTVNCGRIKFSGILAKPVAPTNLICEECEQRIASLFCLECKEVFCSKCANLCHPREYNGAVMHFHEEKGWIRPLQFGDKSRVVPPPNFVMPDEDLFPEDMMKVRDLSVPHSLATQNFPNSNELKSSVTYEYKSKFSANQMVIFKDPITGRDAFGRVLTEWSETGSAAAPPGFRGAGSKLFYVVEMLGLIANARKISNLLRLCNPVVQKKNENYGTIAGSVDVENRYTSKLARNIEKKIAQYEAVQRLGPINHLRYLGPDANDEDSDIYSSYSNASIEHHHPPPPAVDRIGNYDGVDLNIYANKDTEIESQLSAANPNWHPVPANQRSIEDYLDASAGLVRKSYTKRASNLILLGDQEMDELESHVTRLIERKATLLTLLVDGKMRRTEQLEKKHYFALWNHFTMNIRAYELFLAAAMIQSRARVWLCRNKLQEMRVLRKGKHYRQWQALHSQFKYSLSKKSHYSVTTNNVFFFDTHLDLNRFCDFKRRMELRIMRLLSRRRLQLFAQCIKRWKESTSEFGEENLVSSHINDSSIDLDSASAAKYPLEAAKFLDRYNDATAKEHAKRIAKYRIKTGVSLEDSGYEDLVSLPLRLPEITQLPLPTQMQLSSDAAVADPVIIDVPSTSPPRSPSPAGDAPQLPLIVHPSSRPSTAMDIPSYFPAEAIPSLPPLVEIYDPRSAEGRLTIGRDRRVNYCNYHVTMRGPTDASFWIVPGRLACGSTPLGNGCTTESRIPVSSISALMMAGVDCYVSLMEESEESMYEEEFFAQLEKEKHQLGQKIPRCSVAEAMKTAFMKTGYSASEIVVDNSLIIEKQRAKLAALPEYSKNDPRLQKILKEKLRYQARIKLASDRIDKAKAQLKRVPKKVDWFRLPTPAASVLSESQTLLNLWDIEKLLKDGRNVYLYSKEGHGRVGMYGALLLGRFYSLHPYEALYRIQASHDSSVVEEKRTVAVTCPQLPAQRKIVADLLTINNRILEPTATRSQLDPQLLAEKLPRRELMYKANKSETSQTRRSSTATILSNEAGSGNIMPSNGKDKDNYSFPTRRISVMSTTSNEGGSTASNDGKATLKVQSPLPVVYQEELDIEEYRTKNARYKESLTFEPGFALQFENALASSGHREYVTVVHSGVPTLVNESAKRLDPALNPSLPLIRKPKLYTAY